MLTGACVGSVCKCVLVLVLVKTVFQPKTVVRLRGQLLCRQLSLFLLKKKKHLTCTRLYGLPDCTVRRFLHTERVCRPSELPEASVMSLCVSQCREWRLLQSGAWVMMQQAVTQMRWNVVVCEYNYLRQVVSAHPNHGKKNQV